MVPTLARTCFALLLSARAHGLPAAETSCPAGFKGCISEDGEDSTWGRFKSLLFNTKQKVGNYTDRLSDDILTERDTTNEYYDIATDFYEWGWGSSFHFATRYKGETLAESITRHEHFLAAKLGLKPGQRAADLGMGVGGPLRSIAKFSGASITGVSINDYQVRRARKLTQQRESAALANLMDYKVGDFTRLVPDVFDAATLDAIYYIESSCHISNRTEIFLEGARTLKPGGRLFAYEWVLTDRYNASDDSHREIKSGIEWGNGIENLIPATEAVQAVRDAGFNVLEHGDLQDIAEEWYGSNNIPWYHDMGQEYAASSLHGFLLSGFGARVMTGFLSLAGKLGLVPKDVLDTQNMLLRGKVNLVAGGQGKIFTPMYYILAEMPQA